MSARGGVRVVRAANASQDAAGRILFAGLRQPARTFGDDEHAGEEEERRGGGQTEHPAPTLLAEPGIANKLVARARGQVPPDEPIDILRHENADDDRELIDRNEFAANLRRRDFGDIHRRKTRGQADGHAAEDAPGDENREGSGEGVAERGDGEEEGGGDQ